MQVQVNIPFYHKPPTIEVLQINAIPHLYIRVIIFYLGDSVIKENNTMLYLDLFDEDYLSHSPKTGVVIPRGLQYLRKLYSLNETSITEYYLKRNFAVKNTHILSRFLEHIPPHFNYDNFRYIEYMDKRVEYLAKHFKFTSDIEKGIVHPPHFFGNNGEEIILVNYEPFNANEVAKNWRTEPCIDILTHPKNDTRLLLPLGSLDKSRGGLSSVVIDPLKLAIKYRCFLKEQHNNQIKGESVYGKNFFVIKYVLAPMMKDSIDHMFLNRVMDKYYGREIVTPDLTHRFKIFEPTKQLDRYVDDTLNVITDKKLDFTNVLRNIKLVFNDDAGDLLALPGLGGTRQSRWAMIISRLEYMCFIYDVAVDKGRSKEHINDWQRLVTRLKRDKGLLGEFSFESSIRIQDLMDKIEQM